MTHRGRCTSMILDLSSSWGYKSKITTDPARCHSEMDRGAAAGPPTDPWLDATRSVQGAGQCVDEGDDARGKVGQMDQQLVTTLTDLEQSRRCGWRAGNTVASFGAILAP